MEGNRKMGIYKRGNGWEVAIPTGERYKNGRLKYRRELLPTEEEAYIREKEILNILANKVISINKQFSNKPLKTPKKEKAPKQETFKSIANKWLESKKKEVTLKTWERYSLILKKHLLPEFGSRNINSIKEEDIIEYLENNPNSGTTKRQHYVILKGIFKLVKLNNVMEDIKRPKKNTTTINCIKDPQELAAFVHSFQGTVLFIPVYIASVTGMRLSEIAALRWQDIDLVNGYIYVTESLQWAKNEETKERYWYVKDTKSKYSCRTININAKDIEILKEHKFKQQGKQNDFVCLDTLKRPICKDSIGPNFRDQAKRKGYDITFHSLRHSHATILILIYKIPPKTVSRRLGHSDISVTLSIYSQFIPEQDELCSQAMETAFNLHTNTHKIHTKTLAI